MSFSVISVTSSSPSSLRFLFEEVDEEELM